MNAATTIRELCPEEISLVGGGDTIGYYEQLFAVMLSGAVLGALTAGAATAGLGTIPGAISGALIAGTSYTVKEYIEWVIENYW